MVMITRSAYRKATESSNSSDISQNNIITMPPWCSSGKVYERRKPRRVPSWEAQSSYPLRENIWEYLNDKSNFSDTQTHGKVKKIKKHGSRGIVKLFICLLIGFGLIVPYWIPVKIPNTALLKSVLKDLKFLSFVHVHSTSVSEECCDRLKYLTLALAKIEQELRSSIRLRRKLLLSPSSTNNELTTKHHTTERLIRGARAFKGSNTKEFGAQVALWGVVPLWRTAPSPETILALRQPKPSDCWPFSGSSGEVIIELPRKMAVSSMSVEHVRPDTVRSAPKNFIVYGILENGTYVKAAEGMYEYNKPAKQYFLLNNRIALKRIVFRVLSNQGNVKYTCVYRVHLYRNYYENKFLT